MGKPMRNIQSIKMQNSQNSKHRIFFIGNNKLQCRQSSSAYLFQIKQTKKTQAPWRSYRGSRIVASSAGISCYADAGSTALLITKAFASFIKMYLLLLFSECCWVGFQRSTGIH